MKSSTARADSLRAPSEDDVALAYDALDPKSRGFFTARDVRRVADAHGFADWTDGAIDPCARRSNPRSSDAPWIPGRADDERYVRGRRRALKARARGA